MAEIAFMSVDPDNETSGQYEANEEDSSNESAQADEHIPKMKEIEEHINNYSEALQNRPGTEVLEICGETVNPHKKVNAEDFQVLKVIGKGGYGTVYLVQKATKSPDKDKFYAMKVLKKAKLIRNEKNTMHTLSERNILQMLKHPFLVRLHYAFQNRSNLYIVLEYCPGGELFRYLETECFLMEDAACFYISEIALAIGHLHSLGIIYRDLKPENILLDKDGHVKLTDFGLSKEGVCTTNTFCGTIEYMAPEIIRCAGHGRAVDWWSLGTLLFDMLSGGPPFSQEGNKKATAEKILKSQVKFPPSFSTEAIHLIRGLLKKDPKERLGTKNDVEDIKQHSFFVQRGVNWDDVYNRKMEPPFKPELASDSDVSMFDPSFTGMKPIVSPGNTDDTIPVDLFQGFSFVASSVVEPPRAIIPDLSRLRSGPRSRLYRGLGASPAPGSIVTSSLAQVPEVPPNEQMDFDTPPASELCGVDLRDFASPTRPIQTLNGVGSGLSRLCEDEDEDNIPGAQAIRTAGGGGGGGGPSRNVPAPAAKPPPPSPTSPTATLSPSTAKNGPRRLADTKPCSYPNLLITRSGEPNVPNGHPSSGNLTTPTNQDSCSAASGNSSTASFARSKSHHHHHSHHQVSNGGNGKDGKCSVM
uniref:Non-specific serine/threonine protein kinase n=1 Tax=Mesocestoides corti TaxID=53468 RepID=A0A5K3FAY0_MESCO